jgi:hypothetical protein
MGAVAGVVVVTALVVVAAGGVEAEAVLRVRCCSPLTPQTPSPFLTVCYGVSPTPPVRKVCGVPLVTQSTVIFGPRVSNPV